MQPAFLPGRNGAAITQKGRISTLRFMQTFFIGLTNETRFRNFCQCSLGAWPASLYILLFIFINSNNRYVRIRHTLSALLQIIPDEDDIVTSPAEGPRISPRLRRQVEELLFRNILRELVFIGERISRSLLVAT